MLSKLSLSIDFPGNNLESLFDVVQEFDSFPFQHPFPQLREFELKTIKTEGHIRSKLETMIDSEFNNFTPESHYFSNTVRKLILEMQLCPTALPELMKNFPNVEHLNVRLPDDSHDLFITPILSYKDVFRFWPKPKTFEVSGHGGLLYCGFKVPNSNAEFCGIFQEDM